MVFLWNTSKVLLHPFWLFGGSWLLQVRDKLRRGKGTHSFQKSEGDFGVFLETGNQAICSDIQGFIKPSANSVDDCFILLGLMEIALIACRRNPLSLRIAARLGPFKDDMMTRESAFIFFSSVIFWGKNNDNACSASSMPNLRE